jgi:hypothetical protein
MYEAWRSRRPWAANCCYCALTTLRNPDFDDNISSNEPRFRLSMAWRVQSARMREQHPTVPNLIPVFCNELVEFDVRCWWIGVAPEIGLQLRLHNYEHHGTLWP